MHAFKYKVMSTSRYATLPKRVGAPRRQDSTRYIVAEIYGCYRSGWASFSLCAIALAASSQGLIAPTVPKGVRIVSAFDLCPSLEEQSSRSVGGLVYDAIVVVAAWPGRPRTDWVSVQFHDGNSDHGDEDDDTDGDVDSDDGKGGDEDGIVEDDDDAHQHDDLHEAFSANGDPSGTDARRRVGRRGSALMSPRSDLMAAAAQAAGDDLNEFIVTVAQHPQFPQRDMPNGMPGGARWWLRTKRPKIDGAFNVGRNGFLSLVCGECTDGKARCPSCVGMWNRTRRLWPPTYDDCDSGDASDRPHGLATRRSVPLRQSVRQAFSAVATARVPPVEAPAPTRCLATATATTTTQRASRARAHGPSDVSDAQRGRDVPESVNTRCFISGPRCGRHRCPSPCRRVDTQSATHVWVHCDRGCRALFHRACWRAMSGAVPVPLDLAGQTRARCLTPDCWGHLTRVVSFAPGALNLGRIEWEEASTKDTNNDCANGKPCSPCPTLDNVEVTDKAEALEDGATVVNAHVDASQRASHGNHGGIVNDGGDARLRETTVATMATHEVDDRTTVVIDLARPAVVYRKGAPHGNDARAQPKRTRMRAQKKQRSRARQKLTLVEWHDSAKAPRTNPWAGDDAQWPSFFVEGDTDGIDDRPHRHSTAAAPPERPTKPTTTWHFAVWDTKRRTVSRDQAASTAPTAHPARRDRRQR